jgi:hypothetical protein
MTLPTTITLSGPEVRTLRSDGSGFWGAVDLPPGNYTAEVEGADPRAQRMTRTVRAGQVTWFLPYSIYLPLLWRK